jgi:hypothetical protein
MPASALSFKAQAIWLGSGGMLCVAAGWVAYRIWTRNRVSPEERERRRRKALVSHGKITDATLVDISDDALFYSYLVRGVEYTACQDVATLKDYMPADVHAFGGGPVSVRYQPKNPADSIVVAEGWSGLRARKGVSEGRSERSDA